MRRSPDVGTVLYEGFWVTIYLVAVVACLAAGYIVVVNYVIPNARTAAMAVGGTVGAFAVMYALGYMKLVLPEKVRQWDNRGDGR